MDIDRLFVRTLRDLEERTASTDEYTVLMSAALLRKLLLDESRLADQVNRNHRLKLRYRISGVSPYEKLVLEDRPTFWCIEDALDPDGPLAYAPYDATRDQFLARQVIFFAGKRITVRDVIDQLANIEGGVHSGSPKDDRQRALQAAAHFYNRSGLPGAVSQTRLIGRITVRGLRPLRDAIVSAGTAAWASVGPYGSVNLEDDHGGTPPRY